MRIFVALDRARTLTSAALALQLPLFTVSRAIKRMERLAGTMLVKRNSAGFTLTDVGREYLQACTEVLDAQAKAEAVLHAYRRQLAGTLRIGAPATFARSVLSVIFPAFATKFPKLSISIDLYSSAWNREPTARHDVFFKVRTPQQSRHHLRTFPAIRQGLFASPAYLKANPAPVHPVISTVMRASQAPRMKRFHLGTSLEAPSIFLSGRLHGWDATTHQSRRLL